MIFSELIRTNKEAFIEKVKDLASFLGTTPEHLMFLMWFETAKTLDHTITNKIGATGLIQFMPRTAIALGTTTDKLRAMTNVEQLDWVRKYFEQPHLLKHRGKYKDYVELYLAIF